MKKNTIRLTKWLLSKMQSENWFTKLSSSKSREVFCINSFLKNFAKFTGKHLCWTFFFNEVAGLRPAALLKKTLQHRWFSVNFAKVLRTSFFYRTPSVASSSIFPNVTDIRDLKYCLFVVVKLLSLFIANILVSMKTVIQVRNRGWSISSRGRWSNSFTAALQLWWNKYFANFAEKYLWRSPILIKFQVHCLQIYETEDSHTRFLTGILRNFPVQPFNRTHLEEFLWRSIFLVFTFWYI